MLPDELEPPTKASYSAHLVWHEAGQFREAIWAVDGAANSYKPANLLANEITSLAGTMTVSTLEDVRPRTLDLRRRASEEPDVKRRVLRYLLADDRVAEAVGALLGTRARETKLTYTGWKVEALTDGSGYKVAYTYTDSLKANEVSWRVSGDGRVIEPLDDTSRLAVAVLRTADAAEGSGG